jgi:hypothetical protein
MRSIRSAARSSAAIALAAAVALSCRFDPSYRDVAAPPSKTCDVGDKRCDSGKVETCVGDALSQSWQLVDDCSAKALVCAPGLYACTTCLPGALGCTGQAVTQCDAQGAQMVAMQTCDVDKGLACRQGACQNLCDDATELHSNIGCEYWGADLDNAMISASLNAAAQQYAIVVSNAEPDVPARVTVMVDDAQVGAPAQLRVVGTAVIAPHNLEVFKLGPREVDGSPDGEFNTGTGTALTRHAYRVTSSMPIVAYQFNPLENVNVFSNDASQLLPVSGLNGSGRAYVVAGWPQTIATTGDPKTNFGVDLRAFLAIIATRPDTHVHVKTTVRVIPGGPLSSGLAAGGEADFVLQPFDVMNLETGDFNADFTGSLVDSDQPIAVFPGSEASDAPFYTTLSDRFCCADHLEEQLPPVRAVGKTYALGRMPNRTRAVLAAGGDVGIIDEPEFFRVVAASPGKTHVTTTMPPPFDSFDLNDEGADMVITAHQDFTLKADQAVTVLDVQSSQDASGIIRGLPGGDPSTTFVSPIEQWRNDYVLLTPDKYSFDFLVITAPNGAHVYLDGLPVDGTLCELAPADGLNDMERGSKSPPFVVYRCQLSFPVIDANVPAPNNVHPGKQNDGVHHVQADLAVGIVAYGFDSYVSYAYAGGTELRVINPR